MTFEGEKEAGRYVVKVRYKEGVTLAEPVLYVCMAVTYTYPEEKAISWFSSNHSGLE